MVISVVFVSACVDGLIVLLCFVCASSYDVVWSVVCVGLCLCGVFLCVCVARVIDCAMLCVR